MERILVIQTAFIGDAVLTLPMIEKLKELNPDSEIDVISIPSTEELFLSSPHIANVFVLDKRKTHKSLKELYSFIKDTKARKYNRIYSPHRSFRTAIIILGSGVRETYGFSNTSLKHAYKNLVEYNLNKHEIQRNLDLINYKYDSESWKIKPDLISSEEAKQKVNEYLSVNGLEDGFVSLSPGSVWNTKRYPAEYFIVLIQWLQNRGKKVVLIGGQRDKELTSRIQNESSGVVYDSAGHFTLIESVELLKHCSLLITNDSAPTHLGMCAGIKVLTIYCSTVPQFGFFPYNNLSRFLSEDDLYCKPCGIHGYDKCPVNTFECGYKLIPEKVINTINEMIS
jgi:heptosyltransferase-2